MNKELAINNFLNDRYKNSWESIFTNDKYGNRIKYYFVERLALLDIDHHFRILANDVTTYSNKDVAVTTVYRFDYIYIVVSDFNIKLMVTLVEELPFGSMNKVFTYLKDIYLPFMGKLNKAQSKYAMERITEMINRG